MDNKEWKSLINKLVRNNETKINKYQRNLEFYTRDTKSLSSLKNIKLLDILQTMRLVILGTFKKTLLLLVLIL